MLQWHLRALKHTTISFVRKNPNYAIRRMHLIGANPKRFNAINVSILQIDQEEDYYAKSTNHNRDHSQSKPA